MRIRDILTEDLDLSQMKGEIVSKIKTSNDAELIQKIYTTLNKSGLVGRIAPVLERDTDTKGYIDQLVNIIVETPGKYEEKVAFINGYPHGYIDVDKMLSGEFVKFEQLITGKPGAPIEFIHRVFDALKQVTFGSAKGPGEFGLAVLSPHIKITGKGDLNIGNELVEVKASGAGKDPGAGGGRLGTPGLLNSEKIVDILTKYVKVDLSKGINLNQLGPTFTAAGVTPAIKRKAMNELFTYIFKGSVDVSGIVNAVVADQDPSQQYVKANYEVYQAESGFSGILLMNFGKQVLKYFKDPIQLAKEIFAFSIYVPAKDASNQARYVLAQVTLKPVKEPKNPVAAKVRTTKSAAPVGKGPTPKSPVAPKKTLRPANQPVSQETIPPDSL